MHDDLRPYTIYRAQATLEVLQTSNLESFSLICIDIQLDPNP